jgi:4-hydroxy-L-threonine phosphate dehydrogenase PdxA
MPAKAGCSVTRSIRIIAPAIAAARAEGIDAQGPFAPDTVFMRARHAAPAMPSPSTWWWR